MLWLQAIEKEHLVCAFLLGLDRTTRLQFEQCFDLSGYSFRDIYPTGQERPGRLLTAHRFISAFGRLQNFFWCFTNGESVSRSYKGNDRPSVPNFVSEERGSIVEIYMDDLRICVGALDPGPHSSLPALAAASVKAMLPD
jgi:hypothetical protein